MSLNLFALTALFLSFSRSCTIMLLPQSLKFWSQLSFSLNFGLNWWTALLAQLWFGLVLFLTWASRVNYGWEKVLLFVIILAVLNLFPFFVFHFIVRWGRFSTSRGKQCSVIHSTTNTSDSPTYYSIWGSCCSSLSWIRCFWTQVYAQLLLNCHNFV